MGASVAEEDVGAWCWCPSGGHPAEKGPWISGLSFLILLCFGGGPAGRRGGVFQSGDGLRAGFVSEQCPCGRMAAEPVPSPGGNPAQGGSLGTFCRRDSGQPLHRSDTFAQDPWVARSKDGKGTDWFLLLCK